MSGTSSDIPNFPHLLLYIIFHEIPSWAHYIFTQFTRPTAIPVPELCFRKSTSSPPSSSPLILTKKKKKNLLTLRKKHTSLFIACSCGLVKKGNLHFPSQTQFHWSSQFHWLFYIYLSRKNYLGKWGKT